MPTFKGKAGEGKKREGTRDEGKARERAMEVTRRDLAPRSYRGMDAPVNNNT